MAEKRSVHCVNRTLFSRKIIAIERAASGRRPADKSDTDKRQSCAGPPGEMKTTLHTIDGRYARMDGSYDKEKVQAYCRDGSQIEMVEIEGPFSGIAPQAVLIDTPGIDSTDDAHFLSASSILHQADALFYVVHYNHVHSEENVKFLRSIKDQIPNIFSS